MMTMPSIFNDNLFDFFDDFAPSLPYTKSSANQTGIMKTDISEDDNGYEIKIDLPGYAKENISAELKDGYMTIKASQNENKEGKDKSGKVIRRERYTGSCSRSFYVGEDVTQEDIKAKFENGVLTMCVPKKDPTPKVEESKYIAIEG